MSDASNKRAEEFLKISDQFQLGVLATESSHPVTANLSQTAKRDIGAALGLLFEVDKEVLDKYRQFAESSRPHEIASAVVRVLENGGKIFFTGCGSTGRLSIQLVSIWRDLWQKQSARGLVCSPSCEEFENRVFSVMAGGDFALIKAVEGFEDYVEFGKKQIGERGVCAQDVVFAITEGGETSFVIGTAWKGVEVGAKVYFVYNNPDDVLCQHVQRSREIIKDPRIDKINLTTGPMAITGSTRMQATTIQLCVMLTVLEMVVREVMAKLERKTSECLLSPSRSGGERPSSGAATSETPDVAARPCGSTAIELAAPEDGRSPRNREEIMDVPSEFLRGLIEMQATLKSAEVTNQLAKLVSLEETIYRSGHKNNYFADRFGIDVLTDTTERCPTYCTPAFRKFDDVAAAESWAFLFVPQASTPEAWTRIIKRAPRCVQWSEQEVSALVGTEKAPRTCEILRKISHAELMRFKIGLDGLKYRQIAKGDCAIGIIFDAEKDSLLSPTGFHRRQLEAAQRAGAKIGVLYLGAKESLAEVGEFISNWAAECISVLVPVPKTGFLLDGVTRVGVKMLLNALSTCTMVRLGRVMGNYMIWVVPSNLKLIDRATRYIQKLTRLDYRAANHLLFEIIEYVEPRMKSDRAYPPVVGIAVMRARYGIGNEEAEKRLAEAE